MEKTTPSVNGDDVAAVTVPDSLKTGFNLAIDSRLLEGLIQPSESIVSSP